MLLTLLNKKTLWLAAIIFILSIGLILPTVAFAAGTIPQGQDGTRQDISSIKESIGDITNFLFSLGVALAVVNVMWQGFKMMGGNPNSGEDAKKTIVKAFFGLATMLMAKMIVALFINTLGNSL